MLIRFLKIIVTIVSILSFSLGICSQINTQAASDFDKGAIVAAMFKQHTYKWYGGINTL
ncbi:hypothetical protein NAH09_10170 [Francisella tularensis subsp. holarctica]|uniref:hypothetical protein n=1 Tax=Francisella tularensis TaxID=263 RepID=UPI002381B937|nr:hypothetical protein [Francisella tularensis]MDE4994486.1 hypothetical protein [Francisella tularensis subsp. holarctica]